MSAATREIIEIPFHQDRLYAVKDGDITRVVDLRQICERLGLDWSAQWRRIDRNPILKTCVAIMAIQLPGDDQVRDVTTLPIEYINGWLFGIQASRVSEQYRSSVLTYQRECFTVLHRHFFASRDAAQGRVGGPMSRDELRQMIREESKAAIKESLRLIGHVVKGINNKRARATEETFQTGMDDLKSNMAKAVVRWMSVTELLAREGMLGHRSNGALAKMLHFRIRQFANRRDRTKERMVQDGEDVYTTALINDYLDLGGGAKLLNEHRARRNPGKTHKRADLFS